MPRVRALPADCGVEEYAVPRDHGSRASDDIESTRGSRRQKLDCSGFRGAAQLRSAVMSNGERSGCLVGHKLKRGKPLNRLG